MSFVMGVKREDPQEEPKHHVAHPQAGKPMS